MAKSPSRPRRWADACSDAANALSDIDEAKAKLEAALDELNSIKDEYGEWKDNLPENLAGSALGDKLEEVSNLDFEGAGTEIDNAVDTARQVIDDAEAMDLPRGFGKD